MVEDIIEVNMIASENWKTELRLICVDFGIVMRGMKQPQLALFTLCDQAFRYFWEEKSLYKRLYFSKDKKIFLVKFILAEKTLFSLRIFFAKFQNLVRLKLHTQLSPVTIFFHMF